MLINYMPDYYKKSKIFSSLLKVYEEEINKNNRAISDLQDQLFVDTATWGLDAWEKELNIPTELSKDYDERREFVKSKLRGTGTCTVEMIKNAARAYTNAEIEVIEKSAGSTFIVKFISIKGIPKDIQRFKSTIEVIKPAHMTYSLEYTYTTWGEVKATTWSQISKGTWEALKTREVI